MKSKHYIIFLILILLPGISGCAWQSQGLHVKRIDTIPENFINISEDRMRFFPHLEEAILNEGTSVETPANELCEIRGFLILHDTDYICYKNNYYEIGVYSAD